MSYQNMTEIEKLRHLGRLSEDVRESLWDGMTRAEILRVLDAWMASGWDFYPDQWTRAQLVDAIRYGIAPSWHPDETPITYEATNRDREALRDDMKNHIAKQIAAIVLDTLERNVRIAKEQGVTFVPIMPARRSSIELHDLAEIHKAVANNLGQLLEAVFEPEVRL